MEQEIKEIVITKRPMGILKYKKCTYGDYKDDPTAQTAEIDFDLFLYDHKRDVYIRKQPYHTKDGSLVAYVYPAHIFTEWSIELENKVFVNKITWNN